MNQNHVDLRRIVKYFQLTYPGHFTIIDGNPDAPISSVTLYSELMTHQSFLKAVKDAVLICPNGVQVTYSVGRVTITFTVGGPDIINKGERK